MLSVFLLINGVQDRHWLSLLEEALAPLGKLQVAAEPKAMRYILKYDYKAIIIDASTVDNFSLLVSRIRSQRSNARIIIATASPTWQRAREAFRSGATDYIRKSLNKEDLLSSLQVALAKPLPPWPR